jgi:hypothetical protein
MTSSTYSLPSRARGACIFQEISEGRAICNSMSAKDVQWISTHQRSHAMLDRREEVWVRAASASIAHGDDLGLAPEWGDQLLAEFDKRFLKNNTCCCDIYNITSYEILHKGELKRTGDIAIHKNCPLHGTLTNKGEV